MIRRQHSRRHLERLLVAAAFGEPRPRESWRRLRHVVSRAWQLTDTGRHSLREFLHSIDGQDERA
jgi:tRNA C32,U32 (ribose-2'-O)-methylase TrmJ